MHLYDVHISGEKYRVGIDLTGITQEQGHDPAKAMAIQLHKDRTGNDEPVEISLYVGRMYTTNDCPGYEQEEEGE